MLIDLRANSQYNDKIARHRWSQKYIRTTVKRLINVLRASKKFNVKIDLSVIEISNFFDSHLLKEMKERVLDK